MTTRSDIVEKIVKLRALGDGTSSEAEAVAAFKAAERLMRGYEIEEAELAMAEATGRVVVDVVDGYSVDTMVGRRVRHKAQACIWSSANYCEVKAVSNVTRVIEGKWAPRAVHWVGDRPDVEMAKYLFDVIRGALDREYETWRKRQPSVGHGAKGAFQTAMAHRLNQRLKDMARERSAERKAAMEEAIKALPEAEAINARAAMSNGEIKELTATALVVVSIVEAKRQAVVEEFNRHYGQTKLGRASGFGYGRNGNASAAGRAAAGRVGLGRPVGASNQRRLA